MRFLELAEQGQRFIVISQCLRIVIKNLVGFSYSVQGPSLTQFVLCGPPKRQLTQVRLKGFLVVPLKAEVVASLMKPFCFCDLLTGRRGLFSLRESTCS